MSITTNLQLGQSIVPCVPFVWYREQELTCPIDYISQLQYSKVKETFNTPDNIGISDNENIFVLIQRNILDNSNLYICLHTLLFYELHKNQPIQNNLMIVPPNFNSHIMFEVTTMTHEGYELVEIPGGLKLNQGTLGSVFIHDCAFSPPGCLHFNINKQQTRLLCKISCPQLNINIHALFVLFNDAKENNNNNDIIQELIKKLR